MLAYPCIGCCFCHAPAVSQTRVRTLAIGVPSCCGQRGPLSHPHLPVVQFRTAPAARAQGAASEEQCLLVLLEDQVLTSLAAEISSSISSRELNPGNGGFLHPPAPFCSQP